MNKLEEKLYLEIVLDCENEFCTNSYEPNRDASDPMDLWANQNATLAANAGWVISNLNKVICPSCAKKI